MSYQSKHTSQDLAVLTSSAAVRAAREHLRVSNHCAPQASGEAVRPGAEAPLGILRNSRAAEERQGEENPNKTREKQRSEAPSKTVIQSERFRLQRASAEMLPDMRVAHCLWTETGKFVDLIRRGQDARFGGVQTCGSWSSCPVCSARIAEVRRQELRLLEEWAGSPKQGVRMILMTLTARHRRRALKSLVEKLAAARDRMHGRKVYQRLRGGRLVGTVAVREATHGDRHGWHPHYHVVMLVRAETDVEALELLEPLRRVWLDCLRKEGLSGTAERAFDIRAGDAVSAYLSKHGRDAGDRAKATEARAKWGIAEEMTQSRAKRGRGTEERPSRSPMQILRDVADGDADAARLWQEYCRVMFRKPQIKWSDGLKKLIGLGEVEDEEAAEGEEFTEDKDELLHQFDKESWRHWRRWRAELLAAARQGPEAVADLLRDGVAVDDTMELVESDEMREIIDAAEAKAKAAAIEKRAAKEAAERRADEQAMAEIEALLEEITQMMQEVPTMEPPNMWTTPL